MQGIFFNMVGVTITVSIVIVIMLLLSSFLNGRYTVKWRYFIWMILAIRLLLPIDFGLTSPPVELDFSDREIVYNVDQDRLSDLEPAKPAALGENPTGLQKFQYEKNVNSYKAEMQKAKIAASNTAKISEIAAGLYFIGILVFLLRQFGLYLSFRHATRRWYRDVTNPHIIEIFNKSRTEMGVLSTFKIKVCKKISSPMIVGLFKPTLLLPHEGYQNIDLEVILKHELVHFKRSDLWFKLLLISANALHWFNPIVYLMVREANRDIEISCDEEVLKGADLSFRKRYSERILDLMQGNHFQEAPISTSFHGGKGMMKSRIYHIFDDRVKKKGAISFLAILTLVILFSACQFDIGQNEWKVSYQRTGNSIGGLDEKGNPITEMGEGSMFLNYDFNEDGKNETTFSLLVSEKGKNIKLEYKNDDNGKMVQTRVFKDADPGIEYSIEAANMEDLNSIFILVSINYRGMPFGSGYWEVYKWEDGAFQQIDLKSVTDNLQMKILTPEEVKNNAMKAGVIAYLFDTAKYPVNYPVAALYFKDNLENDTPSGVDYAPMSEYDVEGFDNWGQDAIGKVMSSMKMVSSDEIEGYKGPFRYFLETEEYVYITLPNITATVKQYFQYQDGKWSKVDGYIQ